MNIKIRIAFILSIFIALGYGCEKFARKEWAIRIKNNSNKSISIYAKYMYPDTIIPNDIHSNLKIIGSNNEDDIYGFEVDDQKFERLDLEPLTLFIFSTDSVDNLAWDTIVNNYIILKRLEITSSDLNNNTVSYP